MSWQSFERETYGILYHLVYIYIYTYICTILPEILYFWYMRSI